MKIAHILPVLVLGIVLSQAHTAAAEWSLWPFGKSETKQRESKPNATNGKSTGGSKGFLNLPNPFAKKPAAKKSNFTSWSSPPRPKQQEKPNWFTSMFAPKEPEPPKSVEEWFELEPIRP
ncbi:MAG: hypothetical protein ACOY3P_22485 [Planctomycetota bacterium]